MPDDSVSRFWDKYLMKLKAYGVADKALRRHVRHAEAYIKAYSNIRLAQHTEQNVKAYLAEKGCKKRLKDWYAKGLLPL